ncbi:glutaminase A [Tessaracoccus flavus]|uniref:Glutaminase n=2 Tax=Tessaracoccus flavus TaxID=1610493 RepID=A0A1Q2CFQ2_9ACTN|nr:glutaminase A [Tessaracoccus flavus]
MGPPAALRAGQFRLYAASMPLPLHSFLASQTDRLREVRRGEPMAEPPSMSSGDPERCAVAVANCEGDVVSAGDVGDEFTIQSISKAIAYAYVLEELGHEKVHEFVDVEPSGEAYHVISVEDSSGRPDNPMINAGALVVHSLLPGGDQDERSALVLDLFSRLAGRQLSVDETVFEEELRAGHRNLAIAHLLRAENDLPDDPHDVVAGYTRQCAIRVTAVDLAMMGATLANCGTQPVTGEQIFSPDVVRQTLSVMLTCGMYDDAGDWVSGVGIPAKSGVAGGILAVAPGSLGVAAWSPRLDGHGTSVRGRELVRQVAMKLGLHLLDGRPEPEVDWEASEMK